MLDIWATGKVFALMELIIYWRRQKSKPHRCVCNYKMSLKYKKRELKARVIGGTNLHWAVRK